MSKAPTRQFTVLALDHRFPNLEPETNVLSPIGAGLIDGRQLSPEQQEKALTYCDALLVGPRFPINRARLQLMEKCKAIVRYGIGADNIDVAAATELNIKVSNVPDYCSEEVSIHTVALILALHRRIPELVATVRAGTWAIPKGMQIKRLSDTTVGVVGYGRIGMAVAMRLRSLGYGVIAYDPRFATEMNRPTEVEPVSLETLFARADIVTLHMPLTPETQNFVSADLLQSMKKGSILVNVSRGGLVDQSALYDALVRGHLGGAGLDVTVPEPPDFDDPLLTMDNVIVTPHAAWFSDGSLLDLQIMAAEEAARILQNQTQLWPLTPP